MGIGLTLRDCGNLANDWSYVLAQGGFKGASYIEVMDWVAQGAARTLAETGGLTVVVSWFVVRGSG